MDGDLRERETLSRLRATVAAQKVMISAVRLQLTLRANPYWFLQPRVPAGNPGGGQWLPFAGAALLRLAVAAAEKVRRIGRLVGPMLRRAPKWWTEEDEFPPDEAFDEETGRIGPKTPRRPEHESLRFKNERELKRYLGSAGEGREWHHIVEKRLADKGIFPPEMIHSTDNIVNLPVEVHRRVSARMSRVEPDSDGRVLRSRMEELSFKEQYNIGLEFIEDAYEELGYEYDSIQ